MSEIKITDLVPQETIDKVKELDTTLKTLLDGYTNTAKELAKGVDINVRVVGDIDKLEKLLVEKTKEAATATEKLNSVITQQGQVMANTTNTISRQLMEQERVNKSQREAYTDTEKFKALLEQVNGSYENRVKQLVKTNQAIADNKKQQDALKKALQDGKVSQEQYNAALVKLVMQERELKQTKSDLTNHMKNEEKEMQSVEGSYKNLSQRLELMKKAYKDLTEEERQNPMGREMETAIQNLDAHLKDVSADMGEFQRNVGNYAIAGQNGIVTTESVIAAMQQEAVTTQDLIDQTKILEEAKLKLNSNDAAYQQTLDALNAKIEENKRKLSDVSDIINKNATSVAEAETQNKRLQEALKQVDLSSADAQKRIKELNDKIARNTQLIRDNTPAIQDQTKATEAQKKANEGLAGNMMNLIGLNNNFGSSLRGLEGAGTANVIEGINTKVAALGKTLMGLLANPWVLAFLGIAGVVAGFKWWYDYNKGLAEASRLTENFTGTTGQAADKITSDMQAIADHMGKGYNETIDAANVLVQQFGISWEEAMAKMEDGIQAGADMNGKFLDNIKHFAPALRDAGVSADELVSILAETRNGIFSEKGVNDIIKGGTRLRAMTAKVASALDDCGISSKQMQEDLENGNITMLDAVQQVAGKLKELPENSQEAGKLMKEVFGRTAAEGGTLLIQSIADVNTNLDIAKDRMGELGELNRKQMDAQKELNETMNAIFKMSGTSFEKMTTQCKTYIIQGLTNIIKKSVDIVNWFIRLYNKSVAVRGAVNQIVNVFKTLWEVSKFILNQLIDSFKAMGTVIEGVLTMDWDKVTQGWGDGMKALEGNVETMVKNIAANTADAFNKTLNDEMEEFKVDIDADISDIGGDDRNKLVKTKKNKKGDDEDSNSSKSAKDAEKRAKEELKRLNELEESKISMMEEGHDKELALIRQKFKKKIDEITGNGETENALRLQLAEQCQIEITKCEIKYQQELSKINISNRLAAVEKGSQEELTLKLAQLEASRAAEIEAAKKTGADINLINAKFNKERLEMEEEYAANYADVIANRYAFEQSARDNDMMAEITALRLKYAEELEAAKGNAEKIAEIKEKYSQMEADIADRYAQQTTKATISMLEEILKDESLSAKDRAKFESELAKAKGTLEQQMADEAIKNIDRVNAADAKSKETRTKNAQQWLSVAADCLNQVSELISTVYDGKIQKIEEEQERNTEASDAEQERISELVQHKVITEEEGEARKRAAEAKTAKKNEELEKKKQALKIKQAKWDKANSLAQAGISTALAVVNALQTKPFWLGIAMAAIAGAMGAVQIATIAATPIPAYAKGTDRHRGGPALVGDGGRAEVVLFGGNAWITPDTPTLVNLPEGASVLPNVAEYEGGIASLMNLPTDARSNGPVVVNNNYRDLERKMENVAMLIRQQTNIQHKDAYLAKYEMFKNRI